MSEPKISFKQQLRIHMWLKTMTQSGQRGEMVYYEHTNKRFLVTLENDDLKFVEIEQSERDQSWFSVDEFRGLLER